MTLAAFIAGVVFAVGLAIGGMTRPAKVIAFLDVGGDWDPSLAFVMLGAMAVYAGAYRLCRRMRQPLCAGSFELPRRRPVDVPVVLGATLFGLGWGISGLCPGPAVVSLAVGDGPVWVFTASMLVGSAIHRRSRRDG